MTIGAGVTVNLKVGGSTVYTGTTDSSGIAAISGAAGTYDIEVVDGRGTSRWNTQTFSGTLSCGGTTTVTMSAILGGLKTGFYCSYFCGDPLAGTLYGTDANGTWTLTYDASHAQGAGWYGCASKMSMASVVTALNPGACTVSTTGTANVAYYIGLPAAASYVRDYYGRHGGTAQTSSTPTCSAGVLDLNAGIPLSCIGSIFLTIAQATASATCDPASITATMPSSASSATNPGSGSITITE